jgi:hypothetical protein
MSQEGSVSCLALMHASCLQPTTGAAHTARQGAQQGTVVLPRRKLRAGWVASGSPCATAAACLAAWYSSFVYHAACNPLRARHPTFWQLPLLAWGLP